MNQRAEKNKFKIFETIADTLGITALVIILCSLVLVIIFDWHFLDYIVKGAGVLMLLSMIISTIPYISERNIKKILFNILFIIVIAYVFFN
ncbi:hypothetical protein HYE69_05445 [Staphylococcus sp. GSSP0090]|nr:hypothetical protein [Staphylococcus sp. GSSP0090]